MIFVDTSVWVSFFRGRDPELVSELNSLLDQDQVALASPVRIELLTGSSRADLARLRKLLSALPCYYPSLRTWQDIDLAIERAIGKGQRFGAMDLLIAMIAVENSGKIWSLDHDFERMARIGLIELFSPP